jgi:SAM-dependent methyltransferase
MSKEKGMSIPPKLPDEDLNAYDARMRKLHARGEITTDEFFEGCALESARLYLSETEPLRQSGHGGDLFYWRHTRGMILEAIYHGGSFIDIGCANGHLIESLALWMEQSGVRVDFYGLEISKDLYDLAVRRLPDFAPRLFHGNGLSWKPPFTFDYVYTMILGDLPLELRGAFLENLYDNCLRPGGRLILGPWYGHGLEEEITHLGYAPTGYCEKTCQGTQGSLRRVVWIDKPAAAGNGSR